MNTEQSTGGEAIVTRVFDAPRGRVWACMTEPVHFAGWFGTPPFTTPVSTVTMDVRPGGEFSATMVHDTDGTELPFHGRYREVEAPNRIVQTLDDASDPGNPSIEVLTYTFSGEEAGPTTVTYHQVGHLPAEQYPMIEAGVAGFFDRMDEYLAQL